MNNFFKGITLSNQESTEPSYIQNNNIYSNTNQSNIKQNNSNMFSNIAKLNS